MKKINFGTLIIISFFLGCEMIDTSSSSTNLSEEIVWQKGDIIIKNVTDSLSKVVITGLKRASNHELGYSLKDENEDKLVLSGRIHVFGDLNYDGIPEFYHEDITDFSDTLFGWRHLVRITQDKKITVLSGVFSSLDKKNCNQQVGFEEFYKFALVGEGEPQAVLTGNYSYLDKSGDCSSFQEATSQNSYAMKGNNSYLTRIDNCPIENEKINLGILYQQNQYQLRELKNRHNSFYLLYDYGGKLRACGDDGNSGQSHIELIAGVTIKNGSSNRRTDIMPYVEDEFTNINPAFITYAKDNLIPNPTSSQSNGLTYQFMYQYGYKQQLRKFALLKLIIMQHGEDLLLKEYANASSTMQYIENEDRVVRRDNYNTYNFLEEKRAWAIQEFRNMDFDTKFLESTDYGFLMRRMLDGSEPAIWETMQKIFKLYDNEWYERTFVNQKWTGVVSIDSITYFDQRLLSGTDSIIMHKDSIPEGIAVANGAGITITCKNGKEVTFINNNSNGESEASYTLSGYWPQQNSILVEYLGYEWGNTILINIQTGERKDISWSFYPSKDGQYLAETIEEMEYSAIKLSKLQGDTWKEYGEYAQQSINDGFWIDDNFYFKSGSQFFTFDTLDFNIGVVN